MKSNLKNLAAFGLFGFVALLNIPVQAEVAEKKPIPEPKQIAQPASMNEKSTNISAKESMKKDSTIVKAKNKEAK